jgi:medium-chain acyl-[acyl-carrier-protein] hydrolase
LKAGNLFTVAIPRPKAPFRLFCFPHAGGGPVAFFDWAERLGPEMECVCVQYPARGHRLREQPLTRIEDLAREAEEGLSAVPQRPFAFYGHSLGGIVAFELARRLRRAGNYDLLHLFIGAARPPHLESPFPPIHGLPREAFIQTVQARYGGIPQIIYQEPELLEMFLPGLVADFTAFETYRFQPDAPLDVPITAFGGEKDTVVTPDSLKEWALHTDAGFDMNVLPGGHFFPPSSATELVRLLQTRMAGELPDGKSRRIG